MAEGNRFCVIDDQINKLSAQQAAQSEKLDSLEAFMKEIAVKLTVLDGKWDQAHCTLPPPDPSGKHSSHSTRDSSPPRHTNSQISHKSFHLEVPRLDGVDPKGWIFKANQFFSFHGTLEEQRLTIASFHMDRPALSWYRWMHDNGQLHSWQSFLQVLLVHFGPSEYVDFQGQLAKLMQMGSLVDYLTSFEELSNQVSSFPDSFLLSCFLAGLKADVQREVRSFRPQSLSQAIGLVRLQDDKLHYLRFSTRSSSSHFSDSTRPTPPVAPALPPLLPTPVPSTRPEIPSSSKPTSLPIRGLTLTQIML